MRIGTSTAGQQSAPTRRRIAGVSLALAALALPGALFAQTTPRASYTSAQADSGAVVYEQSCAGCHAADLSGGDGPPLTGAAFKYNWDGKFSNGLVAYIKTGEPRPNGGTLDDGTVSQLVAYLLSMNGVPAGTAPFSGAARAVLVLPGPRAH
jgi:mono/diheme cytochrome c family protein